MYYTQSVTWQLKVNIKRVYSSSMRGFDGSAERIVSSAECEKQVYHFSLCDGYLRRTIRYT